MLFCSISNFEKTVRVNMSNSECLPNFFICIAIFFFVNKMRIGDYDGERRKDYKILVDDPAGQYVVEVERG